MQPAALLKATGGFICVPLPMENITLLNQLNRKPILEENFGFTITSHGTYLEVTVHGMLVKSKIISAFSALAGHPEYYKKHSLWNFLNTQTQISITDLEDIVKLLEFFAPRHPVFPNKSVFLLSGMTNFAIAGIFIDMALKLPFKFKVSFTRKDAMAFLSA